MTRRGLIRRLNELGVYRGSYSLDGSTAGEQFVVSREGGRWAVYYFERGDRVSERVHDTESAAYEDLFERVTRDPTTRCRPGQDERPRPPSH
jgi:hypothetical protein